MPETNAARPAPVPVRWVLPALLILAGLGLFFWLGPGTEPVARPSTLQGQP